MNNIIKFISILIFAFFVKASYSEDTNKIIFNTKLPKFELELNTGLAWLMQCKGNINFTNNIYLKLRVSETFLASEFGFSAGYQRSYSNKGRVQIGIGYSNGKIEPLGNPGGSSPDDTTEYWDGVILEGNYIQYLIKDIVSLGFNIGFNFIISSKKSLPSLNLGLVLGIR
jgi:hypothetical protein